MCLPCDQCVFEGKWPNFIIITCAQRVISKRSFSFFERGGLGGWVGGRGVGVGGGTSTGVQPTCYTLAPSWNSFHSSAVYKITVMVAVVSGGLHRLDPDVCYCAMGQGTDDGFFPLAAAVLFHLLLWQGAQARVKFVQISVLVCRRVDGSLLSDAVTPSRRRIHCCWTNTFFWGGGLGGDGLSTLSKEKTDRIFSASLRKKI